MENTELLLQSWVGFPNIPKQFRIYDEVEIICLTNAIWFKGF